MVFLTISKKVTSLLGPVLFRSGLTARASPLFRNFKMSSPYLDMAFLIPYSQKLISLAIYDESQRAVSQVYRGNNNNSNAQPDSMLQALSFFNQQTKHQDDAIITTKTSISDLRLQVYNDKMRPTLLPTEQWGNVNRWKWNLRIMKWARMEFLISKHGPAVKEALDAYPQLRASPQFTRHPTHTMLLNLARGRLVVSDPTNNTKDATKTKQQRAVVLPSSETLIKAFGMRAWAKEKNSKRLKESMIPILNELGGQLIVVTEEDGQIAMAADVPDSADLSNVSMEDIMEVVTGGHVKSCGPFNAICEEANMYQMWTKEYVQHLGDYLLSNATTTTATAANTTILDIGAGDGLLLHYLRDYMESKLRNEARNNNNNKKKVVMPKFVSTDDGSWGIFAKADVEKLSVEETLEMYAKKSEAKVIVLCSWMPQMVDWTRLFRQAGVEEYILIGEADDGSCGHMWETWGNPEFAPPNDGSSATPPPPPFEMDGYQRWDMGVLSQFQFSRFDCALSRSSKTVSFRRKVIS